MNRVIVFFLVALAIFTTLFFVQSNYFSDDEAPQATQEVVEPQITVYALSLDVTKSQPVKNKTFSAQSVKESELAGAEYTAKTDLVIEPGALFKLDLAAGTYLTQSMISNPSDRDYLYLSLKKEEVPYFYQVTGIGVIQSLALTPGDLVSFVSTTSSKSNLIETGYGDIGDLVSKVIISDARVLQVIKGNEEEDLKDDEDKQYSLVIALKMRDVLKLEMAQKIGDVNIIPSAIANRYLSIRSSDILENQFGVRELRGKE